MTHFGMIVYYQRRINVKSVNLFILRTFLIVLFLQINLPYREALAMQGYARCERLRGVGDGRFQRIRVRGVGNTSGERIRGVGNARGECIRGVGDAKGDCTRYLGDRRGVKATSWVQPESKHSDAYTNHL